MKNDSINARPVLGQIAPPVRPRVLGAAIFAAGIAIPAGFIVMIIDFLMS